MRKLLIFLSILLLAVSEHSIQSPERMRVAEAGIIISGSTGGGANSHWIGYPTTNGTPDAPDGSWLDGADGYVNDDDRMYGLQRTASENGTVTHLNVRWTGQGDYFADAWLVVYINGSLAGQADIPDSPTIDQWSGEYVIIEDSTDSLDFSTGDTISAGVGFEAIGTTGDTWGVSMDSGATWDCYYWSGSLASGPPASATWSASGGNDGAAVIIRYDER
jgi:hypothetical protein